MDQSLIFQSDAPLCVVVMTSNDGVLETIEEFLISVSTSDSDVNLGPIPTATISILNDDGSQQIQMIVLHYVFMSFRCDCLIGE